MRYFVTLLIVVCFFVSAYAEGLGFEQTKILALKNSRIVKAYSQAFEASKYRYDQARGGYLPKIYLTQTGMQTNEPANAAFSKIAQGKFDMNYFLNDMANPNYVSNYETKLEVLQPVYMKGKIYFGIKQAKEMEDASVYTLERIKQQVILNLHRAFYGVALANTALAVTRKSYARTNHKAISTADFEAAIDRIIAGSEKKSSTLSPDEKHRVSYHESGHKVPGNLRSVILAM